VGKRTVSPGYSGSVGFQPVVAVLGPLVDEFPVISDRRGGAGAHRETPLGVFDGACGYLLEAHRSPLLEHGERRMERAGNHGGI
jgi:hypothetical protein